MGGDRRDRSRSRDRRREEPKRDRSRDRDRRDRDEPRRREGGDARSQGDEIAKEREERDRGRDRSPKREDRDRRDDKRDDRDDRGKAKVDEKPDDDTYRAGRQVIVKGLQKNPEKNGSFGALVEFNAEKGRWVVALSTGNANFKEENLELMPDNSDIIDDKEEPPTAKIYITNLSADTTDKDLMGLFGGCGVIAKEKPKTRTPGFEDQWPFAVKLYKAGREGGDAQITYMDPHAAKAAIKTYNRYKFKGAKIGVAYAGQGKVFAEVELQKPWYLREENMGKMDRESGGGGGGGPGGHAPKPGDWTCSCGASVFASKDECFKCGEQKPGKGGGGGGKDGGGKDGGGGGGKDGGKGGKPGDWTCSGCGANVFASKDSCFKCGGARPDGGGGGGGKGGGKDKGKGSKGW